jgi:hypothetical protein
MQHSAKQGALLLHPQVVCPYACCAATKPLHTHVGIGYIDKSAWHKNYGTGNHAVAAAAAVCLFVFPAGYGSASAVNE